jgi:hypothetical protein
MHHARRNEEDIARSEAVPLSPIAEPTGAFHHDVRLVPGVGRLGIVPPRCVELDGKRAVAKQLDEPLAT